jgi:hypothetical protein
MAPSPNPYKLKSAFVDNTIFLVTGKTFQENGNKLHDIMTQSNGTTEWSISHNSNFEVDKFTLLHISHKLKSDPNCPGKQRPISHPSLHLANHTINLSPSHKFLSIILDQSLNFKEQANYALGKGEKYAAQLHQLSQKRRGIPG